MAGGRRKKYGKSTKSKSKQIMLISSSPVGNNTMQFNLTTTITMACTVAGIRWDFDVAGLTVQPAARTYYDWALVVLREGSAKVPLYGDQQQRQGIFTPQQNVIAWGNGIMNPIGQWNDHQTIEGQTKSMRKLQAGDNLFLYVQSSQVMLLDGRVQYFVLS